MLAHFLFPSVRNHSNRKCKNRLFYHFYLYDVIQIDSAKNRSFVCFLYFVLVELTCFQAQIFPWIMRVSVSVKTKAFQICRSWRPWHSETNKHETNILTSCSSSTACLSNSAKTLAYTTQSAQSQLISKRPSVDFDKGQIASLFLSISFISVFVFSLRLSVFHAVTYAFIFPLNGFVQKIQIPGGIYYSFHCLSYRSWVSGLMKQWCAQSEE